MLRKLLQSTLCFVLCPLLVAQQAAQTVPPFAVPHPPQPASATADTEPVQPEKITIPKDTKIELALKEQAVPGSERNGSAIQLVVTRDVVVGGVMALRAGAPVAGVLTVERHDSHKVHRNGRVSIRAQDLESGRPILINLSGRFFAEREAVPNPQYGLNLGPHRSTGLLGLAVAVAIGVLWGLTYRD
jgi:hypothetical protein